MNDHKSKHGTGAYYEQHTWRAKLSKIMKSSSRDFPKKKVQKIRFVDKQINFKIKKKKQEMPICWLTNRRPPKTALFRIDCKYNAEQSKYYQK